MSDGIITWKGDSGKPEGHYTTTTINGVTDDTALAALATAMAAHSNANVANRIFIKINDDDDSPPGTGENVDRFAKLCFRDTDNGKKRYVKLPCPLPADCEQTPDGERVTASAMGTFASALGVATGKTLAALESPVLQKV